jgi:hypothetical protein
MDLSTLRTADWLIVSGGLGFLIFGFFNWFDTGSVGSGAFSFTITGAIPWLLLVASAAFTFVRAARVVDVGRVRWDPIVLGATALAALLVVVRLLVGADASTFVDLPPGVPDGAISRRFPIYLCVIAAVTATVGAYRKFYDAGGRLPDIRARINQR